jgi:hypothetical protein
MGGTSRISREAYVRFRERLGVQAPGRLGDRTLGRPPVIAPTGGCGLFDNA